MFAVYSDPEGMRWVGDGQPIRKDECEAWFEVTEKNYAKRGYGMFAIEKRDSGAVVIGSALVQTMFDAPAGDVAARAGAWLAEIRVALDTCSTRPVARSAA